MTGTSGRPGTVTTPREMVELVRKMVEGTHGIEFADLFAKDGVLEYPFSIPGFPAVLTGREAIREFHSQASSGGRSALDMHEVTSVVHETTDPELVIAEISHHGYSNAADAPYESLALGVMRVVNGEITHYRDFMNPIAVAQSLGRMPALVSALTADE